MATMSSSPSFSSPSRERSTSTKSALSLRAAEFWRRRRCSSMTPRTKVWTRGTSAAHRRVTLLGSYRWASQGRWSDQLKAPRSSNPSRTMLLRCSASAAPAPDVTSYRVPKTLPMMLLRAAAWRCGRRATAPEADCSAAMERSMASASPWRPGSCEATRRGENRCVDATRRRRRQYSPLGANPMARANMSSRADRFTGRSANDGCASTSRAVAGQDDTTAGVSPTENAMSSLARGPAARAISARARCGSPRDSAKMLPNTGRPRGPTIGVTPRRPRPFVHAGPPGDVAHASRATETVARKIRPARRAGWAHRVSEPSSAGSAYTHHVPSVHEQAAEAIAMDELFWLAASSSCYGAT
uniref:Uncharacterized protein n=1 Tax=Zea mays TaxID=4577 RepID=A0A804LZW1_MAIZE